MKGLLTSLCTFLMAASASASVYNTNYLASGTEKALQICDGMMFSSDKYDCAMFVRDYHFSSSAVDVCAKMSFPSDKIDCLKRIANRAFQPQAAQICALNSFGSDQISCLQKVADRRFDPNALTFCASLTFGADRLNCLDSIAEKRFMKAAVDFCTSQFSFATDRITCIGKVAGAYVQEEALRLCKKVTWQSDKMSCVGAVTNRYFSASDLYICERFATNNMTQCLADKSASLEVLPQFNRLERRSDLEIILDSLDYIINGRANTPVIIVRPESKVVAPVNKCRVKQTGEAVETERFYTLARNTARAERKCVVARMANTDNSSTLIDENGAIVGSNLSYRKLADVKRGSKLAGKGCQEFICDDTAK